METEILLVLGIERDQGSLGDPGGAAGLPGDVVGGPDIAGAEVGGPFGEDPQQANGLGISGVGEGEELLTVDFGNRGGDDRAVRDGRIEPQGEFDEGGVAIPVIIVGGGEAGGVRAMSVLPGIAETIAITVGFEGAGELELLVATVRLKPPGRGGETGKSTGMRAEVAPVKSISGTSPDLRDAG